MSHRSLDLAMIVAALFAARAASAAPMAPAADAGVFPPVRAATAAGIVAEVEASGARAVLVNVWATWCEPCREELPDLLRYYRDHRSSGVQLVLISADDEERREEVGRVLRAAATAAGFGPEFGALIFVKSDDDTTFINRFDRKWSGALPATFLFVGRGQRTHSWLGPVTYKELEQRTASLLKSPPTKTRTDNKTDNKTAGSKP